MKPEFDENKEKLVMDGNAFYEIDMECVRNKNSHTGLFVSCFLSISITEKISCKSNGKIEKKMAKRSNFFREI